MTIAKLHGICGQIQRKLGKCRGRGEVLLLFLGQEWSFCLRLNSQDLPRVLWWEFAHHTLDFLPHLKPSGLWATVKKCILHQHWPLVWTHPFCCILYFVCNIVNIC